MCLSCDCREPLATHSDPRNITLSMLQAAADAAGITVEQAGSNIASTMAMFNSETTAEDAFLSHVT